MWQTQVWDLGVPETVEIAGDGIIDEHVRHVFSFGQCHSFAVAVHKLTGWPLRAVDNQGDDGIPDHIMVETPNGRLFDITGFEREGNYGDARPISIARLNKLTKRPKCYLPLDLDIAMPYAQSLLREEFNEDLPAVQLGLSFPIATAHAVPNGEEKPSE